MLLTTFQIPKTIMPKPLTATKQTTDTGIKNYGTGAIRRLRENKIYLPISFPDSTLNLFLNLDSKV